MTITKEVLDAPLSGVENADDLLGDQGLMKERKLRLMLPCRLMCRATGRVVLNPY